MNWYSSQYDYHFSEAPSDEEFRINLENLVENEGSQYLHNQLVNIDPESAKKIHPHNVRRVIRALEVYHCTGKTMTDIQKTQQPELLYDAAMIGLTMEREKLYGRINKRVDLMLQEGLMNEVESFYQEGLRNCQSIQAIGYKELYEFFDGSISLEDAVEKLKQNSRRYAKRQLTWFRNKMDVKWFDMTDVEMPDTFSKKIDEISSYVEGKLKIKSNT